MAEQPADQEGQQTPSDSEGSKMEDGEARVFSASALARQFAEQAQSLQVPPGAAMMERPPVPAKLRPTEPTVHPYSRGSQTKVGRLEQDAEAVRTALQEFDRASLPTPMRPRTNPDLNGGFNGRKMLAWMLTH